MKNVFVDSLYWTAIVKPNDPWREAANQAKQQLDDTILVTTDEVLTKFLAALSKGGPNLRKTAVKMVRAILSNPNVRVVPQSRDSFLAGLKKYSERQDKDYSLTDCISMNVMEEQGINEVLTKDHHFKQEGFVVLIQK